MKKLKTVLAIAVMGLITFNMQSCKSAPSEDKSEETTVIEDNSMETTVSDEASYACPMHPEITGVQGDKCSMCGMDLTSIQGEDHSGHDH